ncbi:MAG: VWA domain-containing protein, partial [Planctomycetota bacterium]|nr:VWA domain-containing protein [Planctomycetota bacterium]
MVMLASLALGPVQFESPEWLILLPICLALTVFFARRSLSGLASVTRLVSLGIRLVVLVLLIGALAEPSWRKVSRDVAVTVVLDTSESVPTAKQAEVDRYIQAAAEAHEKKDDRMGVVTAAKDAVVQALPTRLNKSLVRQSVGSIDSTNLASAVRMAMAGMPKDAANRIVLATDGNETVGSILQAAEVAKALGIPIDVLPLKYKYTNEVLLDRLSVPASA